MMNKFLRFYRKKFWTAEKYARFIGVKIGHSCNIQIKSFGSEPYLIEIGNHVQITSGTKFFTHGGAWVLRSKYPKIDFFGKISVGNNVYIGNNSLILPGVTIKSNVIVAAGSVVTKSVSEGLIVGGNPAKKIGTIENFEKKILNYNINSKGMSYEEKKHLLLTLSDSKTIKKEL